MRSVLLVKTLPVICVMALSNLGCQKDKSLKDDLKQAPKATQQQGQQPPAQTQSTNVLDTQTTPSVVSSPTSADSSVKASTQVEPVTAADKEAKAAKEKQEQEAKAAKEKQDQEAKAAKEKQEQEAKAAKEMQDQEAKAAKEKQDQKAKAAKEKQEQEAKAAKEKQDQKAKAAKVDKASETVIINQFSDVAVNAKNCDQTIKALETKIDGKKRIFILTNRFSKSSKLNKDGSPSIDLVEYDKIKKKFNISFSNGASSTQQKIDLNDGIIEIANDKILISKKSKSSEKFEAQLKSYQIRNSCPNLKAHDLFWVTSGSDLKIDSNAPKFIFSLTLNAKDQNGSDYLLAFQFNDLQAELLTLTKDAKNKLVLISKSTHQIKLVGDSIQIKDNGEIKYIEGRYILTSTVDIPGNGVLKSQTQTQVVEMTPLYLPENISH